MISQFNIQHAHALWSTLVFHFIENKSAHIKEAYGRVCGKWFLHVIVNNTIGVIDLCNTQMIFVLVQMMINGILFPFEKKEELKKRY